MKWQWFAGMDTDWNNWEVGVAFSYWREEWYGARAMLGPWSFCVGRKEDHA